ASPPASPSSCSPLPPRPALSSTARVLPPDHSCRRLPNRPSSRARHSVPCRSCRLSRSGPSRRLPSVFSPILQQRPAAPIDRVFRRQRHAVEGAHGFGVILLRRADIELEAAGIGADDEQPVGGLLAA